MGKKRKTRKNVKQTKLSKILSSSQSSHEAKSRYFTDLSTSEIRRNFREIVSHRYFSSPAQLTKNNNLEKFYKIKSPNVSLDKSIAWCLGMVEYFKTEIQEALNKEESICQLILSGEYLKAISELNYIDDNCGLSIWSLSIRGAIESRYESPLPKVFTTSHILEETKDNNFLNYIVKYSSDYFKDKEIYFTSTRTTELDIERSAPSFTRDFILYRILTLQPTRSYDFEDIFNIEKNSSIIDTFFLLVSYLQYRLSPRGKRDQDLGTVSKLLINLQKIFNYPAIDSMANMNGVVTNWEYDDISASIIDNYTKGKYDVVCTIANQNRIYNFDFSLIEIIVKSDIRSNTLVVTDDIYDVLSNMKNIILRNESYYDSLERISCLGHSFRYLRWFKQLSLFAHKESRFVDKYNREYFETGILINSTVNSPSFSKALPDGLFCNYLDSINEDKGDSTSIEMFRYLNTKKNNLNIYDLEIDTLRRKKYEAEHLANIGEYSSAIDIYRGLTESKDTVISIESSRLLVEALLESGEIEKAIDCFVETSLKNKNLLSIFDTNNILRRSKEIAKGSNNINIPIAYSLHSRFSNSIYDPNLKYSFEIFLSSNNAKFPQDLFGRENEFGKQRLHYFLKWVCTPEVMKLYFEFENLRKIEECRLKVCSYLMENSESSERIQNEVIEINKAHVIKRAAKRVESSRIYVDTSNLIGRNSRQYRTLYERFIELCNEDYSGEKDEKIFSQLEELLKRNDGSRGHIFTKSLSIIHLPHVRLNTKNATFLSLAKLIRTEFTYGERGLNNHLSTRIRHGVLPTTLRKPIVDEDLFIPNTLRLDGFKNDSKWVSGESPFKKKDIDKAWKMLHKFSQDYEDLISEINDEWLQIQTLEEASSGLPQEKKSEGLFNYSTSPLESYSLQKELPLSPSYEDFIRVSTQWLWDRTEYILADVQSAFRNKGKVRAFSLLDELKKEALKIFGGTPEVSEFCNSVDRAKSSLSTQIEAICSWFTHDDIDEEEEFEVETAIDIAKRSLNVDISLTKNVNFSFSERILIYLVDMFFILFENAISKSNVPKEDLEIKLLIDADHDNNITISTRNNCLTEENIEHLNSELDFYRDAYGNENLIKDTLQDEGGTGFFKIWKILEKDLEIPHKNKFLFLDNNNFEVLLLLHNSKSLKII